MENNPVTYLRKIQLNSLYGEFNKGKTMVKYLIELNPGEAEALKVILYSEIHKYRDRQMHASSHGDVFQDPCCNHLSNVITKLEMELFAESDSDS